MRRLTTAEMPIVYPCIGASLHLCLSDVGMRARARQDGSRPAGTRYSLAAAARGGSQRHHTTTAAAPAAAARRRARATRADGRSRLRPRPAAPRPESAPAAAPAPAPAAGPVEPPPAEEPASRRPPRSDCAAGNEGEVEANHTDCVDPRDDRSQPHRLSCAECRCAHAVRHGEAICDAGAGSLAGKNLVFARNLADKAAALAVQLAGK